MQAEKSASKAIFLAVPVGTATGPEWRAVVTGWPDGYKIFFHAAQMAEIAVRADHSGMLLHRSGEAMTSSEIAAALGESAGWCETVLFPALIRLGEGRWEGEAWRCTSSMAAHTLGWQDEKKLLLPGSVPGAPRSKPGRKPKFNRSLTNAERQRYHRTGKLPADVTDCVTNVCHETSRKSHDNFVTDNLQVTNIVERISCHEILKLNTKEMENETATKEIVTNAAAILFDGIEEAISALPVEHRQDARAVAQEAKARPEVIKSNIRLLAARMASAKGCDIDNPSGWLNKAIKKDYAEIERDRAAVKAEVTARAAEREAAQKAKKAVEQAEIAVEIAAAMQIWEQLDEQTRAALETDAEWKISTNKIVPIPSVEPIRTQIMALMYAQGKLQPSC